MRRERIIGIDICKIVGMLMICTLHFVGKGGVLQSDDIVISTAGYLAKSISIVGVNLYILATGYLMCKRDVKLSRIVNVWIETLVYSVTVGIAVSICLGDWGLSGIIKSFLPVTAIEYWYITSYILLLLFIPALNQMVNSLNRGQAYGLLIAITIVFSLWKSIFPNNGLLETGYQQGYGIVWMICIYLFGAILKLYPVQMKTWMLGVFYFLCITCTFVGNCICRSQHILDDGNKMFDYNQIFILYASVALFMLFIKIDIENMKIRKIISCITPHTLAVYLITEQFKFKTIVWKIVADLANMGSRIAGVLISAFGIIIVFIVCVLIDVIRERLFDRLQINQRITKFIDKRLNWVRNIWKKQRQ